ESRLLDHLAPRRMHRRRILGIDHPAGHLEREPGDPVTPLANHHDLATVRDRNDIHPVGRVENEEVAFAAPRMRRAPSMEIENRRAVGDVAFERPPLARLHQKILPARPWLRTIARIRSPGIDPSPPLSRLAERGGPRRG